jgi:hypothetical protein
LDTFSDEKIYSTDGNDTMKIAEKAIKYFKPSSVKHKKDKEDSQKELAILSEEEDFCKLCGRKRKLVIRFSNCKKSCNLRTCPNCILREANLTKERNLKKYCYGCLATIKHDTLTFLNTKP